MVVDTSALICVLLRQPGFESFAQALSEPDEKLIAAANWLETLMLATSRLGVSAHVLVSELAAAVALQVAPVGLALAEEAFSAWRTYGKGRHPAGLNFGDCFSYALAKTRNDSLLYKGEDFRQTDIASALDPAA